MNRLDYDLCSVQEARILVENGCEAQHQLAMFSQRELDDIVEAMANAVYPHAKELAEMSVQETGLGNRKDKYVKDIFASKYLCQRMKSMKVVGIIKEDEEKRLSTSAYRSVLLWRCRRVRVPCRQRFTIRLLR